MKGDFHQTKGTDGFYRIAAEGEKGNPGESGASAYDTWLALGNKGTEEDFIKSLKGEKGDDGVSGKWGDITGDISSQKDLQEALAGKADVATTLGGYGITDAYNKAEINSKLASVYHYKGTVSSYSELPSSGQKIGDVYNVETADSSHGIKAGDNVAWNGTTWDVLAGEIDLTAYATKDELSAGLEGKSNIDHLHTGKYVPLNENGNIVGSYLVRGGWSFGGPISTNGVVNAREGFKNNGVSLDNIYAAKSHTHSVSEISGIESIASGGVEEFSDASKEWSASDIGKIFIYKGLTQGKFINGRLYQCLKYTHVISSGASSSYLMLTLSQSTSETFVNALAGRYDLTSGPVGTTYAVYTNSNGAEVYYNSTNSRWAIRYKTFTEAFILSSGGPEGTYACWDYETSVSITATKYETAGGDPVTEDRYCAVIIDTSPVPIIESTGDLTVYPGISYKLNLSGDVTLSADGGVEGMSGECEIYISTSTHSVTAGTNITFVDTLFSNTTNHCVIKWDGESAKLYVCEVR